MSSYNEEQLKDAQEKLEALCTEHDMKAFNLKNGKGRALELVRRMCGLPHKNAGRPKDEHKEDIGLYVSALDDFWHDIDEEDQSLCNKRPSRKELYDAVVKQFNIQPKTNLYGERSDPRETVRRAYDELKKARKDGLEELSCTAPEDAIPPDANYSQNTVQQNPKNLYSARLLAHNVF